MRTIRLGIVVVVGLAGFLAPLTRGEEQRGEEQRGEEQAAKVRAREAAFAKTMADRDLAAFGTFVAKDAVFMGKTPLRGRPAVVEGWKAYFDGPKAPFSWQPDRVEVVGTGTLAVSSGPVFDPGGERVGTFNSTWRLDEDGEWRVVIDVGCPALPLPVSEARMPAHVRVCRECGEEYRPGVVRCADCGGELEDRFEEQGEGAAAEPVRGETPSPSPTAHRAVFVTSRAADLVPLAERLREKGLEYRLAEAPGRVEGAPSRYGLFVREEDAAGALAAIADLVAPHDGAQVVPSLEAGFDKEQGYLACPACGTKTPAGTGECPECGLVLGAADGEVEEPGD